MNVGNSVTDVGGNFDVTGTASFFGSYVRVQDECGKAELSSNNVGINWGTSRGTDCEFNVPFHQLYSIPFVILLTSMFHSHFSLCTCLTALSIGFTPGFGGPGNTHATRSTYYHTTHINEIARSYRSGNSWLKDRLTAVVNINDNCNAFWNGKVISFYNSGGGCANLAEIAGVIVHEWGHGMDANDVAAGISKPSGEGYADIYAALYDGSSCIGRGGFGNRVCNLEGDGCKGCTGVRDIDYMQHNSGLPHTASWANANCGSSVHCKGHVYSEAVWSLYKRKLQQKPYFYDDLTAHTLTTSLFVKASGNVGTWYNEKAAPFAGCFGLSGYFAFLAADDDDGNLTNGTPRKYYVMNHF